MIKLYYREKTRALRPRWLLEELRLEYQLHRVDVVNGEGQSDNYRQIHPLGQIPAIDIDGQVQIESGAICHLLADQHPEKNLAPAIHHPLRPAYEQWFFYAVGSMEPPAFMVALHGLMLPAEQRIADVIPWANEAYIRRLDPVENLLEENDYLLGEAFSAADIMLGSVLMWLPRALKDFPALKAYVKRLKSRSAYQRATVISIDQNKPRSAC